MLLLELSSSLTTTQESGRKQYCKGACSTGEVVSPRTFNYAKRTRVLPHYPNNSQAQTNKTAKDLILIVVIHNPTKELRRTGDLMDKNLVF